MNFGFRISDCGVANGAPAIRHPQSAIRNRLVNALLFAFIAVIALAGCREPEAAQDTRAQQEKLQREGRGEALIEAARGQLSDLPAAVDTELRPPTAILDASKTPDGQEMLAIAAANPNVEGNPVNIIGVPAGNGRFRVFDVRSGDILKYYIIKDETVDEERQLSGFSKQLAKDLTVAQVVDDNTLLIEGSLPEQVFEPTRMEIWRNMDDRLEEINEKLVRYAERRLPALGWEPGPDDRVLAQIVVWLNQWQRQSEPRVDWKRDPLLDSIDGQLLANATLKEMLAAPALSATIFDAYDVQQVQEAVWLRDISRWAQGDNFNDLARATALFDWTIRNIQLAPDDGAPPHRPWRTLVEGRGTAEERAWVFALLCRQQGLDVVILELPTTTTEAGADTDGKTPPASETKFWLPALVSKDQLYLFDTRLGLPVPGPNGGGVATLAQVQQDDALLRQLDLDNSTATPANRYPVDAIAAKGAVVRIVASPFELSRRALQLQSKLTGDNHLVLTTAPSEFAERLKKEVPGIVDVKLWNKPFRMLSDQLTLGLDDRTKEAIAFEPFAKRPLLWKARMRHFQGRRPNAGADEDALDDHREAAQLYTSKQVRPSDVKIARVSSPDARRVDTLAKQNATYWVGLLSFDEGKVDVAADWLRRVNTDGDSPWAAGVRYNLARALEAQKKFEDAAKLLEEDTSPQRHGNLLRARKLRAAAAKAESEEKEAAAEAEQK
jgi:hypothetical protein